MRTSMPLAVAGLVALAPPMPPSAAAQGALEATWSDMAGSNTLVTEATCSAVTGPTPYNVKCRIAAQATNLVTATPQRGRCTEFLVTAAARTLAGPCSATFEVTMRLHRTSLERQSPQVYACNGTTLDQVTDDPEPVALKGALEYRSSDGLFRTVPVNVVVNNVVSFQGSVARIDAAGVIDEVSGRFPIRCRTSTGNGFTGTYHYLT